MTPSPSDRPYRRARTYQVAVGRVATGWRASSSIHRIVESFTKLAEVELRVCVELCSTFTPACRCRRTADSLAEPEPERLAERKKFWIFGLLDFGLAFDRLAVWQADTERFIPS